MMSDLAHHQTEAVQLIFLEMGKSVMIIMIIIVWIISKYIVYM